MYPSEYHAEDYACEVERERERCPRAAALLETIQETLTYAFGPALRVGSKRHDLKLLLESFVVAIGSDMKRGIDSSEDDVQYVNQKIREARA